VKQSTRIQILERLKDHIKDPTTELVYQTPFELLIAVVLSAQAPMLVLIKQLNRYLRLPTPLNKFWR